MTEREIFDDDKEIVEEDDAQGEEVAARPPLARRLRRAMPAAAVYARYILPAVTALVAVVLSCCYAVKVAAGGKTYEAATVRLYANTFTSARAFVTKEATNVSGGFYGLLTTGAVVGILIGLIAVFLAVLGAVTAIRAFRAGHESELGNRMKVIFKIAFPNRICYFLSQLLLIVPLLYPEYLSLVGRHFMLVGGKSVIFVMLNRPVIVVGVLMVIDLILAVVISRLERQQKMNMFLIFHPEDGGAPSEDGEYEEE